MTVSGLISRAVAKIVTRYPSVARKLSDLHNPVESNDIPWSPVKKKLRDSRVAIVTTAGVHSADQQPFDMDDPDGDPTFRAIDISDAGAELMVTHDYYDHSDADKDINVIFPVDRLRELESEGYIGKTADVHYGFMGHIKGDNIDKLTTEHAPEVARRLRTDGVDVVILTPG